MKRLKTTLQEWQSILHLGGARDETPVATDLAPTRSISGDLAEVIRTNQFYFRVYWAALVLVFLATVILAVIFRSELGGMAAVLGGGGVVQGGVVLRLSAEWKEKARTEMAMTLASQLPPPELAGILKLLLEGIK